jgi:DNA-binding transcriptional ArsR family regulator
MARKSKPANSFDRTRIVAVFKALSNDSRLAVFEEIRRGQARGSYDDKDRLTVCNVADKFDLSLSTISHHIKELRNAGLVTCQRQGQTIL